MMVRDPNVRKSKVVDVLAEFQRRLDERESDESSGGDSTDE